MEKKPSKASTTKTPSTEPTVSTAKEAADALKELEAKYGLAAKKYQLPPFEPLCAEFDIDLIEPGTRRLMREVAKKIFERIDAFRKVLESLLQPDMSVISMQEAERLSQSETEHIGEIVRQLMLLDRQMLLAELDNSEDAYAAFAKACLVEWAGIKRDIAPILATLAKGWTQKQAVKPRHSHYLG